MKTISYNVDKNDNFQAMFRDCKAGDFKVEITDEMFHQIFEMGNPATVNENGKVVLLDMGDQNKIIQYKRSLMSTDYIIIKAYEKVVLGEELDPDFKKRLEEVHKNRESWREEIRKLEADCNDCNKQS